MVEELSSITLKCLYLDLSWVLWCLSILQSSQILGPYKRYFLRGAVENDALFTMKPVSFKTELTPISRPSTITSYTPHLYSSYWRCNLIKSNIRIHSSSCPLTSVVNVPTLLWYMVFPSLLIIYSRPKNITT